MSHVLAVFTRENINEIITQGGTGCWVTNPDRVIKYPYVVCVRNGNHPSSPQDVSHGSAFLIGRIAGVEKRGANDRGQARVFIRISEYALVDAPNAWGRAQNPVWYTQDSVLGIDAAALTFEKVPGSILPTPPTGHQSLAAEDRGSSPATTSGEVRPLTIQEAKAGVAAMFNVSPDSVRITVEG